VSPPTAPKGAVDPVAVTVVGERFAQGATLRTISPAGTATYPAQVTDAGHLTASLDLSGTAATELLLRVVNPDRVISNGWPFDVVTPTPQLTSVAPSTITVGSQAALVVSGTGFIQTSKCHVKGPVTADLALPTTPGAPLGCAFDTTGLPTGPYELWVVNDGVLASNHLPLSVTTSGLPHLDALSPSEAGTGSTVALTVTGTAFVPASLVTFDGTNLTTTYVSATQLYVPQLVLPGTAGVHRVSVTSADNARDFTVSASAPQVTTLSVTPTPTYQGDAATLAFSGNNLGQANGATIQPPVGAAFTIASATATSTTASVAVPLATACAPAPSACPDGLYTAALRFSTGATSSPFQFRVLSNVAVLQSAAPAGGPQGANPLTVSFTVSNLRCAPSPAACATGAAIVFEGNGMAKRSLPPASWSPPTGASASLDLTGLDTGVYALSIVNPGAAASNAVSFTVTPGQPHLVSVSPTSAARQDTPVTVTLQGSNFAKPDANGNAASQVVFLPSRPAWQASTAYAAGAVVQKGDNLYQCTVAGTSGPTGPSGTGSAIPDGSAIWAWAGTWSPLPAGNPVTVTSATAITIAFDTRTAAPGTYLVAVWNPPGPMKSEQKTFTVNP
jgi:hypothetical protein